MTTVSTKSLPTGWFWVGQSQTLRPGQIQSTHIFGEEAVLFRTESGIPSMMGAYCPHLGAHFGHGGAIVGEEIVCPFHGWRLNAAGVLTTVPYSDRAPPRVCTKTWPVLEQDGQLLAWYHPLGQKPDWHPPPLTEAQDPGWTPLGVVRRWGLRADVRFVTQHNIDTPRFSWNHHQQNGDIQTDGPHFHQTSAQPFHLLGWRRALVRQLNGSLTIQAHGLGIIISRATVQAGIALRSTAVFYTVPRAPGRVELIALLSTRRLPMPGANRLFWHRTAAEIIETIEHNIPIWEEQGDPAIRPNAPHFQQWVNQFYTQGDMLP